MAQPFSYRSAAFGISEREDGRSHNLAGFQIAVSLNGVFQRIALADIHLDTAFGHMGEQFVGQLCTLRGVGDVMRRCRTRQEERALACQSLWVEWRNGA